MIKISTTSNPIRQQDWATITVSDDEYYWYYNNALMFEGYCTILTGFELKELWHNDLSKETDIIIKYKTDSETSERINRLIEEIKEVL